MNEQVKAKIIEHTRFGDEELITFEIDFHRFILPELNTYRLVSRNYQSSRAVPVKRIIEQVKNNPMMPVRFGKKKAGMQDDGEHDELVTIKFTDDSEPITVDKETMWRWSALFMSKIAEAYDEAGYHKQVVNRLLEPFMVTKGVITLTGKELAHIFKQRITEEAQPEFKELCLKMKAAYENSTPRILLEGDCHLPYIMQKDDKYFIIDCYEQLTFEQAVQVSVSCCAQVSYRKLDATLEKAKSVYEKLNLFGENPHWSPTEHQVKYVKNNTKELSGNFQTENMVQYRKCLEQGLEF